MTDSGFLIPFENLPERFMKSLEHPSHPPVPASPAATIVLLRDSPSKMEILLLKRDSSASFVPGAYVFPGGQVDPTDWSKKMLTNVDGLTTETAAARLNLSGTSPPAIAYYLAALREAFEETGILVGIGPNLQAPPTAAENVEVEALRNRLMEGSVSFSDILEVLSCRIDGSSIEYLAHCLDGRSVRGLSITQTSPRRGRYSRSLGRLQEVLDEVGGCHASPNTPQHSIMRVVLALSQNPNPFHPRSRILALRVLLDRLEHVPCACLLYTSPSPRD